MNTIKRLACILLIVSLLACSFPLTAFAANDLMYGIGFVDASGLRLRSSPSIVSDTLDIAPNNECVVVMGVSGDWYHVIYDLQEGYMHRDYLNVLTKENAELGYGRVTATRVNIRSGPGTSYKVIEGASKDELCYIIGLNEGWYKIIFGDSIGYMRSDYLELTEYPYENRRSENSPKFFRHGRSIGTAPSASLINGNTANNSTGSEMNKPGNDAGGNGTSISGQSIVNKAAEYLGVPYVYGGASPSGFDCSGLVYYVLKHFGLSPARTPEALYDQGRSVNKADLQPGDIVFFANTGGTGITHVGIYAGNGQFIHSPNSRSTVSYANLTSGYWAEHYYGARRFH